MQALRSTRKIKMCLAHHAWLEKVRKEAYFIYEWRESRRARQDWERARRLLGPQAPHEQVAALAYRFWEERREKSANEDFEAAATIVSDTTPSFEI